MTTKYLFTYTNDADEIITEKVFDTQPEERDIKKLIVEVDLSFHKKEIKELMKATGEYISFANICDYDEWDEDIDGYYSERYYADLKLIDCSQEK